MKKNEIKSDEDLVPINKKLKSKQMVKYKKTRVTNKRNYTNNNFKIWITPIHKIFNGGTQR